MNTEAFVSAWAGRLGFSDDEIEWRIAETKADGLHLALAIDSDDGTTMQHFKERLPDTSQYAIRDALYRVRKRIRPWMADE